MNPFEDRPNLSHDTHLCFPVGLTDLDVDEVEDAGQWKRVQGVMVELLLLLLAYALFVNLGVRYHRVDQLTAGFFDCSLSALHKSDEGSDSDVSELADVFYFGGRELPQ